MFTTPNNKSYLFSNIKDSNKIGTFLSFPFGSESNNDVKCMLFTNKEKLCNKENLDFSSLNKNTTLRKLLLTSMKKQNSWLSIDQVENFTIKKYNHLNNSTEIENAIKKLKENIHERQLGHDIYKEEYILGSVNSFMVNFQERKEIPYEKLFRKNKFPKIGDRCVQCSCMKVYDESEKEETPDSSMSDLEEKLDYIVNEHPRPLDVKLLGIKRKSYK